MATCLEYYGGRLLEFPAEPTLGIALGVVCLFGRSYLEYCRSCQPGPHVKKPYYGVPQGKMLSGVFGIFFMLNVPMSLLYFIFREADDSYNTQEFACFLQSGTTLGPGSYFTIAVISLFIVLIAMMGRRVSVRWQVAQRFNDLGFLVPTGAGRPRIAFAPTQTGCWVMPFVKHFVANAASEAGCDVVCFDNYGHPKFSEFKDDQWLRLNLSLEEKESGLAPGSTTLKVILTDYFTLDIPSNSIDVFVMATGANVPILYLDCKNDEEKESRLAQILSEVNRVLRPGGHLVSSTATMHCPLWDKAVARSGLNVPVQAEESAPTFAKYLPFVFRKIADAMRPDPADPEGHGTGRKGWLPGLVWWTLVPARLHLALGSVEAVGPPVSLGIKDVIPQPISDAFGGDAEIPTNAPLVFKNSLEAAEETYLFPPGRQFRVAEMLIAFNLLSWVVLVLTAWAYMADMQVPGILPYGRQVSAFVMEILQFLPPVIFFNAIGLVEVAKTKGLVVHYVVMRNKVVRTWASQRFNFLILVLVALLLWVPYLVLDYCLIVYEHKTTQEVQQYNVYIAITISLILTFGGKRIMVYMSKRFKKNKMDEDKAEAEDIQRESVISSVELGSDKGSSSEQATKNPLMV